MWLLLLRLYLLAGMVAHKLVWEVMKRRGGRGASGGGGATQLRARLAKLVKLLILVGIVVQVLLPEDWMPALVIQEQPRLLRLVGLTLFTGGSVVAILARIQLGANWSDIETATVLEDQQVVDRGIYHYIRPPIYTGDLLLLLGLELSLNSWLVIGVVLLAPVVLRQAVREERMLIDEFPGYAEYCLRTKRFVPYLF